MSQRTELNSELLSADARGRKHIPFAVFAVILIHIILFVVLLIAAGCRSSARAKANRPTEPEGTHPTERYLQAADTAATMPPLAAATEQVMATEPEVPEETQVQAAAYSVTQKTRAKPRVSRQHAVYIVQSGDTVEKIARRHGTSIEAIKAANKLKGHLIYPGQKLVVKPAAGSTAQVKKAKSSNEV